MFPIEPAGSKKHFKYLLYISIKLRLILKIISKPKDTGLSFNVSTRPFLHIETGSVVDTLLWYIHYFERSILPKL
jgi:hypothetical protein